MLPVRRAVRRRFASGGVPTESKSARARESERDYVKRKKIQRESEGNSGLERLVV